ncbi:hypothetical protein FRC09_004789 [Ceratobasidium sp. 395]|nr:hypothetical protein FRC09_004789 [Ceratobasidium sp. 395]
MRRFEHCRGALHQRKRFKLECRVHSAPKPDAQGVAANESNNLGKEGSGNDADDKSGSGDGLNDEYKDGVTKTKDSRGKDWNPKYIQIVAEVDDDMAKVKADYMKTD